MKYIGIWIITLLLTAYFSRWTRLMRHLAYLFLILLMGCTKKTVAEPETRPGQPKKLETVSQPPKKDSIDIHECLHQDLSKKFDFKTRMETFWTAGTRPDSHFVRVFILLKETGEVIDTLGVGSNYFFHRVFRDCNHVRSYVTGKNENDTIFDYDFGDLLVADLNFDGKEDIALVKDSGGNGGPIYDFYLQDKYLHFIRDSYLSDTLWSFPREINPRNRTLVTQIHANAAGENRTTVQWRGEKRRWVFLESVFVPCCEPVHKN